MSDPHHQGYEHGPDHVDHGHTQGGVLHEGPQPVVCAWRGELRLDEAKHQTAGQLVRTVESFLAGLLPLLRDCGCFLIGHVKGMADAGDAGRVFFSVTSFEGEPSIKGELERPIACCLLTVNVIAFGSDEPRVLAAVLEAAGRYLDAWRVVPA